MVPRIFPPFLSISTSGIGAPALVSSARAWPERPTTSAAIDKKAPYFIETSSFLTVQPERAGEPDQVARESSRGLRSAQNLARFCALGGQHGAAFTRSKWSEGQRAEPRRNDFR